MGIKQGYERFVALPDCLLAQIKHIVEHETQMLIQGCKWLNDCIFRFDIFKKCRKLTASEIGLLKTFALLGTTLKLRVELSVILGKAGLCNNLCGDAVAHVFERHSLALGAACVFIAPVSPKRFGVFLA